MENNVTFFQTNHNIIEQQIKCVSKTLLNFAYESSPNTIFGITSSCDNKAMKFNFCKKILQEMKSEGKNVYMIDADFLCENNNPNVYLCKSLDEINKTLKNQNENFVILNMPCVLTNADTIDYSKFCNKIFMFERYCYTKYENYEKSILQFKVNNIKISGIVTYD